MCRARHVVLPQIVAGLEPENTNIFLQQLAIVCQALLFSAYNPFSIPFDLFQSHFPSARFNAFDPLVSTTGTIRKVCDSNHGTPGGSG